MNILIQIMVAVIVALAIVPVFAAESEYEVVTDGSAADVTFGPQVGESIVQGLYAKSDKGASVVKFYARGGSDRNNIVTASTNNAEIVYIANTSYGITNSDVVVYCYADGSSEKFTISASDTNNVTLDGNISQAGSTSDYLMEVTLQYQLPVGASAALNPNGWIFATPGGSPLYVELDCGTNATLAVTKE